MTSLIHLPYRSLISLKGRDTFKYLQALTTNNLATPASQYTSFLNAQGRVLFEAFIYRTGESECLLETDGRNVEDLQAHLKRYKLRSKFETRVLPPEELGVYALLDGSASSRSSEEQVSKMEGNAALNLVHQIDPRAPGLGHRLLAPDARSLAWLEADAAPVDLYTAARYRGAIAEGPDEMVRERALPIESNLDRAGGLDFHKGCYLGQELTVRTYHTGVVRKRIVPLRVGSAATADRGTALDTEQAAGAAAPWIPGDGDKADITMPQEGGTLRARPAGRVLATLGTLGLGLCRLDRLGVQGTFVRDGETVSVLPYRPDHWPA